MYALYACIRYMQVCAIYAYMRYICIFALYACMRYMHAMHVLYIRSCVCIIFLFASRVNFEVHEAQFLICDLVRGSVPVLYVRVGTPLLVQHIRWQRLVYSQLIFSPVRPGA